MLRQCKNCDFREYLHCGSDPDPSACRNRPDRPWFKLRKYPAKTCEYYRRWNPNSRNRVREFTQLADVRSDTLPALRLL